MFGITTPNTLQDADAGAKTPGGSTSGAEGFTRKACERMIARVRNEAEDLALSKTDLEGSPVSIFEQ
jgi:hypothetical protein